MYESKHMMKETSLIYSKTGNKMELWSIFDWLVVRGEPDRLPTSGWINIFEGKKPKKYDKQPENRLTGKDV